MSITHTTDIVTVWLGSNGAPQRMFWAGHRYRVTDTPTRLGPEPDLLLSPAITHPPRPSTGWRFQGTSDDGDSRVFDVRRRDAGDGWELLRVID
ncbi:hypothetical protein [Humibacter ginsenosidimutans]|uniref:Uncharacterized protein n=1 Tax=Humibacter ginsenosidimutans TaxID=2599293 RepID=A0A5B8M7W3_9MICO|nr:hypothetical protein [Humibacter ginsenosidimutans]QDZ16104.1 hypothetical protein FPZ11_16230 [Humibacter ginsenosidimutans]